MRVLLAALALAAAGSAAAADAIDVPLAAGGDAARGRQVFISREGGHCVMCHRLADLAPAGNVGPPLDGVGVRLTPGQIRLRIVDGTRVNPDSVMPPFWRTEGLARVATAYAGKTILETQQVEDLVAFLSTLK